MWARKKPHYWGGMRWHEVLGMEVEYDHIVRYYPEKIVERRVGVHIPSHTGYNEHWQKDQLEYAETVNVMNSNVCAFCRKKKLNEAGIPKEIML